MQAYGVFFANFIDHQDSEFQSWRPTLLYILHVTYLTHAAEFTEGSPNMIWIKFKVKTYKICSTVGPQNWKPRFQETNHKSHCKYHLNLIKITCNKDSILQVILD